MPLPIKLCSVDDVSHGADDHGGAGRGLLLGLLNAGSVGRVALSAQAMPVIVPVRYRVGGRRVRFRPAGTAGVAGALADNVVAFQADGFDEERCAAWSVHLVGRVTETDGADFELRPTLVQGRWLSFF